MSPDRRSKARAKRPARLNTSGPHGPSSDDAHDVVFFRRHPNDDHAQRMPGREFLNACPTTSRPRRQSSGITECLKVSSEPSTVPPAVTGSTSNSSIPLGGSTTPHNIRNCRRQRPRVESVKVRGEQALWPELRQRRLCRLRDVDRLGRWPRTRTRWLRPVPM